MSLYLNLALSRTLLTNPVYAEFVNGECDTIMGQVRIGKHLSIPLFSEFTYVELGHNGLG